MSVMLGMRIEADPARFMEVVEANEEQFRAIAERARSKGAIHHMFLAGDGTVMVADEWDSAESFQAFWQESSDQIGPLMQQVGATSEPQPVFWRPLETPDRF